MKNRYVVYDRNHPFAYVHAETPEEAIRIACQDFRSLTRELPIGNTTTGRSTSIRVIRYAVTDAPVRSTYHSPGRGHGQ
jgi:hypothetical protein